MNSIKGIEHNNTIKGSCQTCGYPIFTNEDHYEYQGGYTCKCFICKLYFEQDYINAQMSDSDNESNQSLDINDLYPESLDINELENED